jgi:hypothetical protein
MCLRAEAVASLRLNAKKLENSRNRALVETLPIAPGHLGEKDERVDAPSKDGGMETALRKESPPKAVALKPEMPKPTPLHHAPHPTIPDPPFRSQEERLNRLILAQRVQMKSSQALNDNRLMGMRYWLCDQEMLHPPPEIHTFK